MLSDVINAIPSWLAIGIGVGSVVSIIVAGVFVVGGRLFPTDGEPTKIGGENRRHLEIRSYLREAHIDFRENHHIGSIETEFYLPNEDVAITFDPHVYFQLESTTTIPVLCEHEMSIRALSRRLPFEIAQQTLLPPTQDQRVREAFDTLEISVTADPAQIQQAYRERVKHAHPDHGGTQSEFQDLQESYGVAKTHAQTNE